MTRLDRSSHSGEGPAKGSQPLNSLLAGHRVAQPSSAPGSRASVQVGVCGETKGEKRVHLVGGLRIREGCDGKGMPGFNLKMLLSGKCLLFNL